MVAAAFDPKRTSRNLGTTQRPTGSRCVWATKPSVPRWPDALRVIRTQVSDVGHRRRGRAGIVFDRWESSPRMLVNFGPGTRLRRDFFLAGCALRPLVSLLRRSTRQNRSVPRLALWKKSPAVSTASMANVRASTAVALVTGSSSFRSSRFKGLPFAATILARHFPGSCSNAVISSPLYCIARPRCVFITGRTPQPTLKTWCVRH